MALMIDANQGWTVGQALEALPLLLAFDLGWLEEPLAVDAPAADWARLAQSSPIRLAGGENLRGETAFGAAIDAGDLSLIQPAVAKGGRPEEPRGGERVVRAVEFWGVPETQ